MRILSTMFACLLVAAYAATSHAQDGTKNQRLSSSKLTVEELLKAFGKGRISSLYSGPPVDCQIGVDCNASITPVELFDGSGYLVSCSTQVGQITIHVGSSPTFNKKTKITWTINPAAPHNPPTNATYTFKAAGLIILRDDDNVTIKQADSVSDNQLVLTHRFKKRNSIVVYYPLVWQTVGANAPTLCASGDPQIAND